MQWATPTARLLPRLLVGRTSGPVFLADRRAPTSGPRLPADGDIDPTTRRGRLSYPRAEYLFKTASATLDQHHQGWTLHQLRHSAAKRMIRDPNLTLADVQWVLGHAHITTTEIYANPAPDEVISHVLAHHERQRSGPPSLPAPPAPGYRPEVLAALFGTSQITGEA
ncbi:tyrosine-type recombinase/integrase [Nonomuraea sp. NPDC046802]|uniref:tyrosine-type recombinase/integrase n=1 Tax=Nonomuraea sp. NPDC046802 TaxID=3154919 RepID=UPI00340BFC35